MYGNNFYVKCYAKYPFIFKTNELSKADKYAKNIISKGFYSKSEIYLVNARYKLGEYLIKTYIEKDGKIINV